MTKLFQAQSRELDPQKRKQMVWDIDHKLQAEIARPAGQEPHAACQQHLQQLALRGCLVGLLVLGHPPVLLSTEPRNSPG
jgi:hypothetical protein